MVYTLPTNVTAAYEANDVTKQYGTYLNPEGQQITPVMTLPDGRTIYQITENMQALNDVLARAREFKRQEQTPKKGKQLDDIVGELPKAA